MRIYLGIFFALVCSGACAQSPTYELDGRGFVSAPFTCNATEGPSRAIALPGDIPTPTLIRRVILANNGNWASGQSGYWTLSLDRGGRWTTAAGYPLAQAAPFYTLIPLASLSATLGSPVANVQTFDPPVVARAGDLFILDVPCANGVAQPGWEIEYEVPYGTVAAAPITPPAALQNIFGPTLVAGDNGAAAGLSIRSATTPVVGGPYSKVQVTFRGGSSAGLSCAHVSVGIQSNGPNTAAIPVELLFGGVSGFTGAAGGLSTSDLTPFQIANGQTLIVTCDASGGDISVWGSSPVNGFWKNGAATYNQASVTSFNQSSTIYGLYLVQAK